MANIDFDALFAPAGAAPTQAGGEQPPKKKARVQRESLLQFDHLSVQGLNPCGESAVRTCSLEKLWASRKQGNKAAAYHTNWASPKFRQGVRVSQVAGTLLQSFKRLRGDHYKKALKDDIYAAIIKEMDTIEPHLQKLNAGARQMQKSKGCTSLRHAGSSTDVLPKKSLEEELNQAVRGIHAWFALPTTPVRGVLALFGNGGGFHASQVMDRTMRAWIAVGTPNDMPEAIKARWDSQGIEDETPVDEAEGLFKE